MTQKVKMLARGSAGSSLIELALALPILLVLLAGIADFAVYIYASVEVMNAAHAGALYGAQNPVTACDNLGMVAAAKADSNDLIGITATASGANSNCKPSALCSCSESPGTFAACNTITCTGRVDEYVKVNTSATINAFFTWPGLPASVVPKGQSIMRVEE